MKNIFYILFVLIVLILIGKWNGKIALIIAALILLGAMEMNFPKIQNAIAKGVKANG